MGMFDHYIPDPPIPCPACGKVLEGWQGKDGPNALMVWRQGRAAPVDQDIEDEEVRLLDEQLARFRLPDSFVIYDMCDCRREWVEAVGTTTDQVWTRTELTKSSG